MENMQDFIELGKRIRSSKIRQTGKFKSIIMNLQTMETLEIYDQLVIMLLQEEINFQCLINAGSDFKHGEIKEEEFRKFLFATLA